MAADATYSYMYAIPPGQVKDVNEWIKLASESLQKCTGKTLLDMMEGVQTLEEIPNNERYAVLSHGNQTDPIYNYFNRAALLQFQVSQDDDNHHLRRLYSLPSRYSAPDWGNLRQDREAEIKAVARAAQPTKNVQLIPTAIRQTLNQVDGSENEKRCCFQLRNVTLWNVYSRSGGNAVDSVRLGQMAIFDRTLVEPVHTGTGAVPSATAANDRKEQQGYKE